MDKKNVISKTIKVLYVYASLRHNCRFHPIQKYLNDGVKLKASCCNKNCQGNHIQRDKEYPFDF
jgi:hypothetical protein